MRMIDLSSAATPRPNGGLLRGARGGDEIDGVRRGVIEGDVLPGLERRAERRAAFGGVREDLRTFVPDVASLVPREDHRFQRHAVRRGARLNSHRVAAGPTAELGGHVLAEIRE